MRTVANGLTLHVPGLSAEPISQAALQSFHTQLAARQAAQQQTLEDLRSSLRSAEQQMQQQLSDVTSRLTTQDSNVRAKTAQLDDANGAQHRMKFT